MNKEKTAMQMLIEELDKLGKLGILVDSAKNVAEQLLQKEQEQIEQAFDSGYSEGLGAGTGIGALKYSDVSYYQYKYGVER